MRPRCRVNTATAPLTTKNGMTTNLHSLSSFVKIIVRARNLSWESFFELSQKHSPKQRICTAHRRYNLRLFTILQMITSYTFLPSSTRTVIPNERSFLNRKNDSASRYSIPAFSTWEGALVHWIASLNKAYKRVTNIPEKWELMTPERN